MVIGKGKVIEEYERFYERAVDFFLDLKVMNTDQQVIYSVYTKKGRQSLKPAIEIQPYLPKPPGNPWFYLGFLCRKVIKIPWQNIPTCMNKYFFQQNSTKYSLFRNRGNGREKIRKVQVKNKEIWFKFHLFQLLSIPYTIYNTVHVSFIQICSFFFLHVVFVFG